MDLINADIINGLLSPTNITFLVDGFLNIIVGVVILVTGNIASARIARLLRSYLSKIKKFDQTLVPLIASAIRYAILILALLITLDMVGVETTSLIAVLGAAGLAIGLALQGTLSNVAAGVMLLFLRPFQIGDWIESGENSGTVSEVGLFATIITTFDNVYIYVPNSNIWGNRIVNHSRHNTRRMDIDIGIAYSTDLDYAEKTLLALADDERVLKKPEPQFLIVRFDDSAVIVRLRLYARNSVYWDLYWDMLRQVKPTLDAANIEIPFPQIDYRIIKS